ncbi:hypothetical protein AKJ37_06590, partial [candidate division MSBL1 archaeon SCGC-AAA259I09]
KLLSERYGIATETEDLADFRSELIRSLFFGDYPVEKIVVLKGDTDYPKMSQITDRFIEKLEENVPKEVEKEPVDIYDFDEVFQKMLEIFRKHSGDGSSFFLNVSSAPKLTLIAMVSAAYFYRRQGKIEVFYVSPEKYLIPDIISELGNLNGDNDEEVLDDLKGIRDELMNSGVAVGASNYEVIPLFPIESINELDLKILGVLGESETTDSITELVGKLEEKTGKEIKRTSVQYRLKKLEEMDLVATKRVERRMEIEISRLGRIYLESSRGEKKHETEER